MDTGDHLRSAHGVASGRWVLVRPDGYAAAAGPTAGLAAVERRLDELAVTRVA